jgi:hypothetical protein
MLAILVVRAGGGVIEWRAVIGDLAAGAAANRATTPQLRQAMTAAIKAAPCLHLIDAPFARTT